MAVESQETVFVGIVYCPVCCTNQDVEEDIPEGQTREVEFECSTCETVFKVVVNPDAFAMHSQH